MEKAAARRKSLQLVKLELSTELGICKLGIDTELHGKRLLCKVQLLQLVTLDVPIA